MSHLKLKWALAALAALAMPAFSARAVEVLDNKKINELVAQGVALDVVMKFIDTATAKSPGNPNQGAQLRFDGSSEALLETQKSGVAGKWKPDEIGTLQKKIIELAGRDQKYLAELVARYMNICYNSDAGEMESMKRVLAREGSRVVPYLIANMEQEDERKRGGVVEALAAIGDKRDETVRAVVLMLGDQAKPVRMRAAQTLVELAGTNIEKLGAELILKLNAPSGKVDGAAMALGYMRDLRAIGPLAKVIKESDDSDARVCAAFALGRMRAITPEATAVLLDSVLDERDQKLRVAAAKALAADLRDKRAPSYAIRAFHRFRKGREELVRDAMMYMKDITMLDFLVEQYDSDDPKLKKAIHEALVQLTDDQQDDKDAWRAVVETFRGRPDWRPAPEPQKLPDARPERPEREGTQRKNDAENSPTSVRYK